MKEKVKEVTGFERFNQRKYFQNLFLVRFAPRFVGHFNASILDYRLVDSGAFLR